MRYLSLFSGIEAASAAWEPLGWKPVAFSEIDPFCCRLLKAKWPDVPNLGDVRNVTFRSFRRPFDVLVGGSPCQSLSVSGKREGMKGVSGIVTEFLRVMEDFRPRIVVWKNVPGALTADKGAFFRHVLRRFQRAGYGCAWRVLDAQYFGVPQRRRRVFLVGVLGGGFRAGEILFEPEVLQGNASESGTEGADPRPASGENPEGAGRFVSRGFEGALCLSDECPTITRRVSSAPDVTVFDIQPNRGARKFEGVTPTLTSRMGTGGNNVPAIFAEKHGHIYEPANGVCPTLRRCQPYGGDALLAGNERLRRLTPEECERLMGFPTGWTAIPDEKGRPACDSARYKALGNSMAVPVMAWIGKRIEKVMEE